MALHRMILGGVILTALVSGCEPTSPSPFREGAAGPSSSARPGVLIRAASGQMLLEIEAYNAMVELSRSVALALQDNDIRHGVYEALHASPYPEHKIHFRTFTGAGIGSVLLQAAGTRTGRTLIEMRALRDSALDLELYMPVREHFSRWTGGDNLIVVTSFDGDVDVPIGFSLAGEPVELTSAKVPPETPALVLVRREATFERFAPASVWQHGVAAGLYMTFSSIANDFEGWPNGNPEFEVHVNWRLEGDSVGRFNRCAGEAESTPYYFNHDDSTWTGLVLLVDSASAIAAESVDSLMTFWVWEDDNAPCELRTSNQDDPQEIWEDIEAEHRKGWRNRWSQYFADPILVYFGVDVWNVVQSLFTASWEDDFVGLMLPPSGVGQSYGDANMAIVDRERTVQGRAQLIRYDSPPPSLSVSILGPIVVGPNNYDCSQWTASMGSGATPFQYSWAGLFSGTESYVSGTVPQTGGVLEVSVTDANLAEGIASITIGYDPAHLDYCQ